VVQQVVAVLHLARKKLTENEEDVGQTVRLVNVVKGLLRLRESFVTLDVRNLVVRQVKANDRHNFLNAFLILLQHFGICIER
jgi:hypothetical protein